MTAWRALYEQHRELRRRSVDLVAAVRRRLVTLAERGHCAGTIQGRFTRRDRGGLREWFIQADGAGADQESLTALPSLRDARLTVLVLLSRKADHVHQFTAMIEGTTPDNLPWAAAVHLEGDQDPDAADRKGSGACGHAALHCHVGPTLDHEPKVRVPLPAIAPADALDWLLATVIPGWEPAPWHEVAVDRTQR